jgi:acyl-ACP thioesterase
MNDVQTERKNVWEEICQIRFGAVDRSDRLTLASVFNFFQEAAISHAENLGVGRDSMAQIGQVWLISRMSVQIEKRPLYGDTVNIRTWPRGIEKLFALRDFDIRNSRDVPVIQARSCWLIIDIEKRRPLRPQYMAEMLPLNDGLDALPSGAVGLTERKDLHKASERKAAYSDLDYNGHVNNISYIQWIQDTLNTGLLENAGRMRLDINYLNEILPGETAEIWTAPISGDIAVGDIAYNNMFAFEGRKSGGQPAFRAELRLGGSSQ